MAFLSIEEYSGLPSAIGGAQVQVPGNLLAVQKVTTSGTSAQSSALNAATRYVVLTSDTAAFWRVGANPTAVATDRYLPSNTPRGFSVPGVSGDKIAAIN